MSRDRGRAGATSRESPRIIRRLGVSGRMLGAIAVPIVVLALTLGSAVAQRHRDVRRADAVSERVELLDELVTLQSALFQEQVGAEVFRVPGREPPAELLDNTAFGQLVASEPEELAAHTDAALAAVPADERPFAQDELDQVRTTAAGSERGPSPTDEYDRLQEQLRAEMTSHLTFVRHSAIELGDIRLIEAGTTFERSVRLPGDAGTLLAATADLWAAPSSLRPELQSVVAGARATFRTSSTRLVDSVTASSPDDVHDAVTTLQPPAALSTLVEGAIAGELTTPERAAGQPVEAAVALLSGVDWLIEVDDLPVAAADWAEGASQEVSADARRKQQISASLALLAIGVSIAAAVWFGRSIVRPVRRLTDQAERIGSGQLDPAPPETSGPPEIVRASEAMNDMAENLVLLERKSHALARVDFEDPSLSQPLPGRLGGALQLSMEVLAASVEQREALQSRLEHQASHDSLTGIGNRASLTAVLQQMDERATTDGTRSAIVFIDLDDFKGVNDRYGHTVGDEVLRVAAARMTETAPARALVARLGGDEFVIAIPDVVDLDEPVEVARRVIDRLLLPIELESRTVEIRASAGVAVAGPDVRGGDISPLSLPHMADLAVYTAKLESSGEIAVYDDALDRRLIEEREVEAALARALAADGELRLVFQPIVAASDGEVRAVEALLRWERTTGGPITPDRFIPIAERSHLIIDVDQWVIERALRQLADWERHLPTASLATAVNISGRSLLDRSFVERVTTAVEHSGVDPSRLWLEVTETALVSDLDLAAAQLRELSAIGLRVVIDDFGTGYTSVAHLRALPVDELKIDASFVRQLPEQENRILIELITQVAHQLHVPTVAEGVETEDQAAMLRAIGCDSLQGYHFARPLPPDELARWIARHRLRVGRGTRPG